MKRAALFVGINEYHSPITSLAYARKDASYLYDFFVRSKSYRAELVDLLTSDVVTDDAVIEKVESLMSSLEAGDLFLFYFSGHGVEDRGQHKLLHTNARQLGGEWRGALSIRTLRELTQKRGVQSIFIIDSCRDSLLEGSKGVGLGNESQARSVSLRALSKEPEDNNFLRPIILCSCSAGEQAFEIAQLQQGVFSRALLEVLTKASCASMPELSKQMTAVIKTLLNKYGLSGQQTPELILPSGSEAYLLDAQAPSHNTPRGDGEDPLLSLLAAAHGGSADAQYHLGDYYLQAQKLSEAAQYYRQAADQQHPAAQRCLATCYLKGLGVTKDEAQAHLWYQAAASAGDSEACFQLAELCMAQHPEKARALYQQAATLGHTDAQFYLGRCYAKGYGESVDFEEAIQWFLRAAEQNHAKAQYALGILYLKGYGVTANEPEAARWFLRSAQQSESKAQYQLGACYANGIGVPRDTRRAIAWYQKAADQGDAQAQYALGECYEDAHGVEADIEEAARWYSAAAHQGHVAAQYQLAQYYDKMDRSHKAFQWYRKAAEQGHCKACAQLGFYYQRGIGTPRDFAKAMEWNLIAAQKGCVVAMYNLAHCYEKADNGLQDLQKAVYWYREAAANGDKDAKKRLRQLT